VRSGCRFVGIEQVNVQLRQSLLGRIQFVWCHHLVVCQGLRLDSLRHLGGDKA